MPKDDLNYKFTENGIVYDFYDVFVPAENFRQPSLWVWGIGNEGRLEQMIPHKELLRSPHLPVEQIGNRLLLGQEVLQQQSRPMELSGFGVMREVEDLEQTILLQTEVLQLPHLPEEMIGNRFLVL